MRHSEIAKLIRSQLKVAMPKSKANNVIQIGQRSLVDAEAMGEMIGFTAH